MQIRHGKMWFIYMTSVVNSCQEMVVESCSATFYDIGGDMSLDGEGTIINLDKISTIHCICTACSLSLYS